MSVEDKVTQLVECQPEKLMVIGSIPILVKMVLWCSGLTCFLVTEKIVGSNPISAELFMEDIMKQYRKKPVVINAVQITNETFDAPHPNDDHIPGLIYDPVKRQVEIKTLEGTMIGNLGDWIIKGVNGELYPCKPDIFEKTYDEV